MAALKFPHITRKISASPPPVPSSHLFFILLLIFILLNIFQPVLFPPSSEKLLRFQLMQNPNSRSLHEKLGRYYLPVNLIEAQREYQLAQESYTNKTIENESVLGIESAPLATWENIKNQESKLKEESLYWQTVFSQFPDYKYALLKLTSIYLQLGDKEKARELLADFLKISPEDETIQELNKKLK